MTGARSDVTEGRVWARRREQPGNTMIDRMPGTLLPRIRLQECVRMCPAERGGMATRPHSYQRPAPWLSDLDHDFNPGFDGPRHPHTLPTWARLPYTPSILCLLVQLALKDSVNAIPLQRLDASEEGQRQSNFPRR